MSSAATDRTQTRGPRTVLVLVAFLVATYAVAAVGGIASNKGVNGWYVDADKPPFNPPNWLFGPVWTILYAAMAVAAWLVWRRRASHPRAVRSALLVWWLQLAVNLVWTPAFFGYQLLWVALVIIVALDALVALTLVRFWPLSALAGWLFVPYLAWVLFATALNASVAWLN